MIPSPWYFEPIIAQPAYLVIIPRMGIDEEKSK